MDIGVNELNSPVEKKQEIDSVDIQEPKTHEIIENESQVSTENAEEIIEEIIPELPVEKVQETEKIVEKIFDKKEVVSGFEEAKTQIKDLYDTIFGYGDNFKPTYEDTLGDLLSYLGGLAYKLGAEKNYTEVFGINVNTLNDRYYSVSYIPYAIKIAVWSYKNKGKNNVLTILDGIVRCAYAFAYKINENDIEDKVYKTVLSIIEFIENNDISLN